MELNEIILKIKEATGMGENEIMQRIREKQRELYGLVSPEGAAHILARELGIELNTCELVKLKDLKPNMTGLRVKSRITKVIEREFERDGVRKKVANVFLIDDTAEAKLVLWDSLIERYALNEGEVIEIVNAYTKKNIFGDVELRLGTFGEIKKLPDDSSLPYKGRVYIPERISKMEPGKRYKVRAAVVAVLRNNIFYAVCPECDTIIKNSTCPTHGEVAPVYTMIINAVIDDGYGNMRAVFFRENAEKLLGIETKEAMQNKELLEEAFENILGKEFIFAGKVRRNEMFRRNEFIVEEIENVDVLKEINKIGNWIHGGSVS